MEKRFLKRITTMEGNGPADGATDQMSSGRAELTGVLFLGTFLLTTATYLKI
jgi:hypothetical protein